MCGRFIITHPVTALVHMFGARPGNDLPDAPRYNICPTQPVVVVTAEAGDEAPARRLRAMRWGLLPVWYKTPTDGPLIINARAETIAVKPSFREAVRTRRCIVPASGFYEWSAGPDKSRLPWLFTRSDTSPMAFAAVWQRWERDGLAMDTCAIVSTAAGPGMAGVHDREPVILEPGDWPLWLGEAGHGAAALMRHSPAGTLATHRVGVAVNSNRASGSQLIEPLPA